MALIEYLRSTPLPLPIEAKSAPASKEERRGTVTASFERGDLFLENRHGQTYRLSWSGEEEHGERALAVPAGIYKLKTYRIVRERDGKRWHLSATSPSIQDVTVTAGKHTTIAIDDGIAMSAKLHGDRAQMSIKGDGGAGLSIYQGEKRIPINYQIVGRSGKIVARGAMRYG